MHRPHARLAELVCRHPAAAMPAPHSQGDHTARAVSRARHLDCVTAMQEDWGLPARPDSGGASTLPAAPAAAAATSAAQLRGLKGAPVGLCRLYPTHSLLCPSAGWQCRLQHIRVCLHGRSPARPEYGNSEGLGEDHDGGIQLPGGLPAPAAALSGCRRAALHAPAGRGAGAACPGSRWGRTAGACRHMAAPAAAACCLPPAALVARGALLPARHTLTRPAAHSALP